MKVYFVGAGPGDPELITIKGQRLLSEADVVIYAGSLINRELLRNCKPSCKLIDSAELSLEEVVSIYEKYAKENSKIVRLHSGEPSLYGAIREQIDWLKENEIDFEVVPGVSSFAASASALNAELTLPGVSQTVIITRMPGRTPVPDWQKISELAKHKATMCIFLSVHMIEKLVDELKQGYSENTPVAVVERASWPDEKVIKGTLKDIAFAVKEAGITKTAMIIVGDVLGDDYERSKLYDPNFAHGYRG